MFFRPAQHQQEQDASRRSSEHDVAKESEPDEAEELDIPLDNPAWSNDAWHDIPLTALEKGGKGHTLSSEVKCQINGLVKKQQRETAQTYVAA